MRYERGEDMKEMEELYREMLAEFQRLTGTAISGVLKGIGAGKEYLDATIRFSMSEFTTREEFTENQAFKVNEIGDKLFGNHQGKKQEFDEKIERYDMQYDTFTVEIGRAHV